MPPFPEFRDVFRIVGSVEVLHQFEAHHLRRPNGHIRVPRKITVDLNGKKNGGNDKTQSFKMRWIGVYRINGNRYPVGNDHFLEQTPRHKLEAVGYPSVLKAVLLTELVQQVLRPFDGPCHQLGIEHDVKGIDAEMPLRLLVPPVYLDDIAEALEGVERQSDGQDQVQCSDGIVPPHRLGQMGQVGVEEIEIFEHEKNQAGGHDTEYQIILPPCPLGLFDPNTRKIVHYNSECKNKDVYRDKIHIEQAAGPKQKTPPEFMR